MKQIYKALAFMLVLCLVGCSSGITKSGVTASPTVSVTTANTLKSSLTSQQSSPDTKPSATLPRTTASTESIPTQTSKIQLQTSQPPSTDSITTEISPPHEIVQPKPSDEDFVRVKDHIPDIVVDLRYAAENNFTCQRIYGFNELWLRYGTVKKLISVQEELKQSGLFLKIWDGFRPPSAQFELWEICPDPTYVSDPNKGFSSHSRGNTVDITLVYADGTEVEMPTDFDDFSELADRDYSDCDKEAGLNALMLEQIMVKYGFKPYSGEWWHFSDSKSYPVDKSFEPIEALRYYAVCNEFISLRTQPDITADVITKIPAYDEFQVLAYYGDFALIEYNGLTGYVLKNYIEVLK